MNKGFLVLETGDIFTGSLIGNLSEASGEVVFNTSMTGFQEMLTDPGYAGQILTFCYPLVGNCGINMEDNESDHVQVAGVVIGELCENYSHYQAEKSLVEQLSAARVTGIADIDTRALVKIIRQHGTVQGIITDSLDKAQANRTWQEPNHALGSCTSWVEKVAIVEKQVYAPADQVQDAPHVVLMDFGTKKSLIHSLVAEGCQVTVVPYHYTCAQIDDLQPDGVLVSSGPGDPLALSTYFPELQKISSAYPTLGIGLGHQMLALAHGAQTKKLKFGHRGSNHPVKEVSTGKVMMTAQNHGFTLVEESINLHEFMVTHYNVNDGSIEGLKHISLPLSTVQFHPEAHPGPSDTAHILTQFVQQLQIGDMNYALT